MKPAIVIDTFPPGVNKGTMTPLRPLQPYDRDVVNAGWKKFNDED